MLWTIEEDAKCKEITFLNLASTATKKTYPGLLGPSPAEERFLWANSACCKDVWEETGGLKCKERCRLFGTQL